MKWSPLVSLRDRYKTELAGKALSCNYRGRKSHMDHHDGSGLQTLRETDTGGFLPVRCSPEGIRVQQSHILQTNNSVSRKQRQ